MKYLCYVLAGLFGAAMSVCGLNLFMWQFWMLFVLYGVATGLEEWLKNRENVG